MGLALLWELDPPWPQGPGQFLCCPGCKRPPFLSLERPLHPKEKVLEQALQWCKLPEPSTAYLLVRKVPIGEGSCLFTGKRHLPWLGCKALHEPMAIPAE